jgi:serine protease Do
MQPCRRALLGFFLVVLTALALLSAGPAAAQDVKALLKQSRGSVFLLRLFDASGREVGGGTGFLVQEGVVVTNDHVVEPASRIEVVLSDERTVDAVGIIARDPDNDLALLKVPALGVPPLPVETSATLEPGDRIIVLGNPLGLSGTVSDGIVAALRPQGLGPESEDFFENTPLIQITAPISSGSSGSPVLNSRGAVVGVAVSQYVYGQNLNFAIPADSLIALMARRPLDQLESPLAAAGQADRWVYLRNLGISAAVFVAIFLALRRLK